MVKIALYCRVSSREQAINGFGIDDQERRCREYIDIYYEDQGYELQLFREEGVSAKNIERPELQKVIELIRKKKIDVLVVYTYDRLTRRLKDFINLLELMQAKDVVLDTVKEKFNTSSATGRMFVHMIVAMSEWEEDTIAERTSRGLEESAKQGNYCKAKYPMGYRKVKEGKKTTLIIDEEKAEIIKYIFDEISNGRTDFSLRHELRQKHVANITWNTRSIVNIIKNPIYKGTFVMKGKEYPNQVPAIVSEEKWELANKELKAKQKERRFQYVFAGHVYCGSCGSQMINTCSTNNGAHKTYLYYRCKECGLRYSQNKILDKCIDTFDKIVKNETIEERINKDIKIIRSLKSDIDRLKEIENDGSLELEYCQKEIKEDENKLIEIQSDLMNFINRRSHTFNKLEFNKKRSFLSRNVDQIIVYGSPKQCVVVYKPCAIILEKDCINLSEKIKRKFF